MFTDIEYESMASIAPDELLGFYDKQKHETSHSREKIQRMLDNTACVVVARRGGKLIGFARGVTDGLCGRLAECKLDPAYQGPACITKKDGRIEHDDAGIARSMASRVIKALKDVGVERIETIAYETEVDFCEELGFRPHRGAVAMELAGENLVSADRATESSIAG